MPTVAYRVPLFHSPRLRSQQRHTPRLIRGLRRVDTNKEPFRPAQTVMLLPVTRWLRWAGHTFWCVSFSAWTNFHTER